MNFIKLLCLVNRQAGEFHCGNFKSTPGYFCKDRSDVPFLDSQRLDHRKRDISCHRTIDMIETAKNKDIL
jgi:hypothetical protein